VVRMERHLDAVVASLEGLVDRVVDHLVDEVMEATEARRADVHARPEPDRLETFEDRDVPSGVVRGIVYLSHEKSPANSAFAGKRKCIRRGGRAAPVQAPLLWLSQQIRAGLDPQFRRRAQPPLAPAPVRLRRTVPLSAQASCPGAARG